MKNLQEEILTNADKSNKALYGLSDERRKEIISLLVHWTMIAESNLEDKYRELDRAEKYPDIGKDTWAYYHKSASPYDYMREHNIDYYAELEAEVESMWQRRVKLDKEK